MGYKRVILKFSGEALGGGSGTIDKNMCRYIAEELKPVLAIGAEIGIVIGGGNLFRGASLTGYDRVTADQMGMLATIINALAIRDTFQEEQIITKIMSAFSVEGIIDPFNREKACKHFSKNRVVIFAGGTGNPLVTTDSALSLRGVELKADLLIKATNVDGVYSSDPKKNKDATFFTKLSYQEVISQELKVMDLAAFAQCRDHGMILRVYNLYKKGALLKIVSGEDEGTLIRP